HGHHGRAPERRFDRGQSRSGFPRPFRDARASHRLPMVSSSATPHSGGTAMKRLQDKVAIITGGSGGIGKAVAERFLDEGASVMLVDIDQDGLDAARKALGGGDRIAIAKADVSNEADVERYVKATVDA